MQPYTYELTINKPLVDWLTVTSFDLNFLSYWKSRMAEREGELLHHKIKQYDAVARTIGTGVMRISEGIQGAHEHYMLHLTGAVAEEYLEQVIAQVNQGFATVTRIDIQVTVPRPQGWNQFETLIQIRKNSKKIVRWIESRDYETKEEMSSIYVGAKTSDRFGRIYVKKSDSGMLLRFEAQFGQERAKAVMRQISADRAYKGRILKHEISLTSHREVIDLFTEPLSGLSAYKVRVKKLTSVEKTNQWLISLVFPVIRRQLNDHDNDGTLWDALCRLLEDVSRDARERNGE